MNSEILSKPCTAFEGSRLLMSGPLIEVAMTIKDAIDKGGSLPILVFDDLTGQVIDLDLRGSRDDIIARLSQRAAQHEQKPSLHSTLHAKSRPETRGPGRPKLGVVAREVTLLPSHWEWLSAQPGGASVTLRRLVHEARRTSGPGQERRAAQEAAYSFISAVAGDLPGFEEATRALFAYDRDRFEKQITAWPRDIRDYAIKLAFAG